MTEEAGQQALAVMDAHSPATIFFFQALVLSVSGGCFYFVKHACVMVKLTNQEVDKPRGNRTSY